MKYLNNGQIKNRAVEGKYHSNFYSLCFQKQIHERIIYYSLIVLQITVARVAVSALSSVRSDPARSRDNRYMLIPSVAVHKSYYYFYFGFSFDIVILFFPKYFLIYQLISILCTVWAMRKDSAKD